MKLVSFVAASLAGLLACDAREADPPALAVAALEASGQQFTVHGDIRIATCDPNQPTTLTHRAVYSPTFQARGDGATTCTAANFPGGVPAGCTALVNALRATPVLDPGTASAGDESYSMAPQQWLIDDSTVPATNVPVSYGLSYDVVGAPRGPIVYFQANTRYINDRRPVPSFTAPPSDGGTVELPIEHENLASYRLRLQYTPTIRDGSGHLVASDRIIGVRAVVSLGNTPGTSLVEHQFLYNCSAGTCVDDPRPLDANGAAALTRFLQAPAIDGTQLVPAQPVTPQELVLEIPIVPNTVGDHAGEAYTLALLVQFADGIRTVVTPSFVTPTVAPCAVVDQTYALARPPTRIDGTIQLKPDIADFPTSPYAQSYAPTVRQTDTGGTYYAVNLFGAPTLVAPPSASQPLAFAYLGVPAGNYRIEAPVSSSTNPALFYGQALLTYPGAAPLTWNNGAYHSIFNFPAVGPYEPDGTFVVTDADANGDGLADAPVTLNITADMAYLEGSLALTGCVPDVTAAAADIVGTGASATTRGFSRGLFQPFVPTATTTVGSYIVAAIAGNWIETRYLFDFAGPNQQKGFLWIEPTPANTSTLAAGGATSERTHAPDRAYQLNKATLTLAARDGNGTPIPSRNPMLEINSVSGTGTFSDPNGGATLGRYYAAAQRTDNAGVNTLHTLEIYGPRTSDTVLVRASVEVQSGAGWSRTTFPAVAISMAGTGDGCTDTCVYSSTEPPSTYTDDGQPPVVAGPPSLTLLEGTTTATVTVTVTDFLALREVTANGVPMTAIGGNQYTATVPITPSTTAITIVASDLCRKTTTSAIAVAFSADPCEQPTYDVCTGGALGSIFYVDLLDAADHACRLPCAIAGPDQAIVCDPLAITCVN